MFRKTTEREHFITIHPSSPLKPSSYLDLTESHKNVLPNKNKIGDFFFHDIFISKQKLNYPRISF